MVAPATDPAQLLCSRRAAVTMRCSTYSISGSKHSQRKRSQGYGQTCSYCSARRVKPRAYRPQDQRARDYGRSGPELKTATGLLHNHLEKTQDSFFTFSTETWILGPGSWVAGSDPHVLLPPQAVPVHMNSSTLSSSCSGGHHCPYGHCPSHRPTRPLPIAAS